MPGTLRSRRLRKALEGIGVVCKEEQTVHRGSLMLVLCVNYVYCRLLGKMSVMMLGVVMHTATMDEGGPAAT